MINLNKIVIVGGGSAGWMAAATMIKKFPDLEIVCIESPNYPIVGVGESTIGGIRVWTNFLGIDEKDFMQYTEATYKLSIKFTDFYEKDYGSFHYPFGFPETSQTVFGINDWYIKKTLYPETPVSDYAETFYPALALANKNKISNNESGVFGNWRKDRDTAYHFDATKFGQWLKNNYCIPRGVNLIQDTVLDIKLDDNGISKLILSSGIELSADLFIDCTGFKSMLLEGALDEEWDDFSNILPNNRAWATRIPYTDIEKEMEPYTNCTAIDNGWVWNIPSWERIGTGYVYSDKYVSPEQALLEFKEYLKSDKMTLVDPNRDVESFEFKDVKFRIGIHRRTFVKNVVAIGLSAGFIEPLESNGLYTTHEFLLKLIKTLSRKRITQSDIDMYNTVTRTMYVNFANFVSMHYALSNRNDTKYWQDISKRNFQSDILNLNIKYKAGL
jgi:flavin-dependent dehydrogenase